MGAKVILLRSQDIFSDSRVLKYESLLKKENIPYAIVGWDRKGLNLKRENTFFIRGEQAFKKGKKQLLIVFGGLFSYLDFFSCI